MKLIWSSMQDLVRIARRTAVLLILCGLSATSWFRVEAREFTVVAYNVENLFDIDGTALYKDYAIASGSGRFAYSPEKLLTKIRNITRIMSEYNDGRGPEIICFQEFEYDRTPASTVEDSDDFLVYWASTTVEQMLTVEPTPAVYGLPVEAFLLKYLEDAGLRGYNVVKPPPGDPETKSAQNNVIFTKFPVVYVESHPTRRARDILEVGVDIDGSTVVVFDNHWKSGASSSKTETIRIENAEVLRRRIDALLHADPRADIIVTGDLNSHYNQDETLSDVSRTGINDVLGSQGDEGALRRRSADLYNLWYEFPPESRRSDAWRGSWGTLMHILVTPGLYDTEGVRYIDNSFFVIVIPGVNADEQFGRPIGWSFYGTTGGGYSDHFPISARFETVDGATQPARTARSDHRFEGGGSRERGSPLFEIDYSSLRKSDAADVSVLAGISDDELNDHFHSVFRIDSKLSSATPPRIKVGARHFDLISFVGRVRNALESLEPGARILAYGELLEYRGKLEFMIQDASWWLD